MKKLAFLTAAAMLLASCGRNSREGSVSGPLIPSNPFEYTNNIQPRWISFENIRGEKGMGGMENNGAKGHACDSITAGSTKRLLDIKGPGIINRMWFTISDRSPAMLRSLVLNIYWDDSEKPAVSVPFGDFFGVGLGRTAVYENALFANPEGRSFNCFVQMPFKTSARIELVNESGVDLLSLYYDIDLQLMKRWDENFLYFHSCWRRDTATVLAEDFEIMPRITGKGRFLGSNICINANPVYKDCWWGEGEVKIYINGDKQFPTLVGTGTEDYIGTAWGQGQFFNNFTGCLIADAKNLQWAFYRYHISDPVYFESDCRVTIQQIGGNEKDVVIEMLRQNIKLIPVAMHKAPRLIRFYRKDSTVNLEDPALPKGWTNFYRSDDMAATSYFYLARPVNELPPLQPVAVRTYKLLQE